MNKVYRIFYKGTGEPYNGKVYLGIGPAKNAIHNACRYTKAYDDYYILEYKIEATTNTMVYEGQEWKEEGVQNG